MAEGKRYYWLKLREDFFHSKRIKKLRNMAGGDTYTIIYLKMQLLALKTDGVLTWTGLEESFADELALDLDEKPEDVEVTLLFLIKTGLVETQDEKQFLFPFVLENTGSETAAAQRSREYRSRNVLQSCCNATPLQQHCDSNATQVKQIPNVEKELEKEKELDIEKEREEEGLREEPKPYPDLSPDPKRTCFRSDTYVLTDEQKKDEIRKYVKMIKSYKERGWGTDGVKALALNKGISLEELKEAYLRDKKGEQI